MKNPNQRQSTIKAIKDLQLMLEGMLELGSNMEVVWELENIYNQGTVLKTANYIRDSLNNEDETPNEEYAVLHKEVIEHMQGTYDVIRKHSPSFKELDLIAAERETRSFYKGEFDDYIISKLTKFITK